MVKTPHSPTKTHGPWRPSKLHSRWKNLAVALVLLSLAAVIIVQSAQLGAPGRASDPGPGGYPTLIAVVLACLAIVLAMQQDTGEPVTSRKSLTYIVGILALLIGYALLLKQLGYVVSTALFLIGGMLLMNVRSFRALVIIGVMVSVGIFWIFYSLFGVSLPRGTLERLIS